MIPFHFSKESDFCVIEFYGNCRDGHAALLRVELQLCNLSDDLIKSLMVITDADWHSIELIDYQAYLNNW